MSSPNTLILSQIEMDDPSAAEQLLLLAAAKLAHEKPGQTLQATALVHDAHVRLVDSNDAQQWDSRGHFVAAAAEALSAEVVQLNYFAGLSLPHVAAAPGISARYADRRWAYVRTWLHQELTGG